MQRIISAKKKISFNFNIFRGQKSSIIFFKEKKLRRKKFFFCKINSFWLKSNLKKYRVSKF